MPKPAVCHTIGVSGKLGNQPPIHFKGCLNTPSPDPCYRHCTAELLHRACDPILTKNFGLFWLMQITLMGLSELRHPSTAAEVKLPFLTVCWEAKGPSCVGGAPLLAEHIITQPWTQQGRNPEDFSLSAAIAHSSDPCSAHWGQRCATAQQPLLPCLPSSADLSLCPAQQRPIFGGKQNWIQFNWIEFFLGFL